MALPDIKLDDRTFEQLVAEAKRRIPGYTPEWTDLNDTDPGLTLVQLFAWPGCQPVSISTSTGVVFFGFIRSRPRAAISWSVSGWVFNCPWPKMRIVPSSPNAAI